MSHQIDNDTDKLTTITWKSKATMQSETITESIQRGMRNQEYFEIKYAKFYLNVIIISLNWYLLFYNKKYWRQLMAR